MSTTIEDIRKELGQYIDKADEKVLVKMYSVLLEVRDENFTEEELKELDRRRKRYLSGKSKAYSRSEARKKLKELQKS